MKNTGFSLSQIRTLYIITTLFLIALSVFTFTQIKGLIDFYDQLSHTNRVNQSLQTIWASVLDAETNKRGHALSGDPLFLDKRNLALTIINTEMRLLDSLTKNDVDQKRHFKILEAAVNEKIVSLRSLSIGENPAEIKTNLDEGVQKAGKVKLHIDGMAETEMQLHELRTKKYSQLSISTRTYIVLLFAGSLLILFFSYLRLNGTLNHLQNLRQELILQNEEKEKRAAELIVANKELHFQNEKKAALAADLVIANKELAFQNEEKEKRAAELAATNKELQLFINISSHDLQEPLRKMQMAASRITGQDYSRLSENGKGQFDKIKLASLSMRTLIDDLITYSRTNNAERNFEKTDLKVIVNEVKTTLREVIDEKNATIETVGLGEISIMPFQFRQLMQNLISNALKFSDPERPPHIIIMSEVIKGSELDHDKLFPDRKYCHISVADNGIGFEPEYKEKIFEVFQRLHGKEKYNGTGIGLAIVKKIVENHGGFITATSQLGKGSSFDIYIPYI